MVLTVDVSLYFVSKASEDTALFVIKTFFFHWCQVYLIYICTASGHLIGGEVGMEMG